MALTPQAELDLPAFIARKRAQWESFSSAMPGLQMVEDANGLRFTVLYGPLEEGVIFGQPEAEMKDVNARAVVNDRKPLFDKYGRGCRGIDLTDDQLSAVLRKWRDGSSALDLPFVPAVHTPKGWRHKK